MNIRHTASTNVRSDSIVGSATTTASYRKDWPSKRWPLHQPLVKDIVKHMRRRKPQERNIQSARLELTEYPDTVLIWNHFLMSGPNCSKH